MWLLRYSVLEFSFSGVFWGGRLACLDGSLARYVIGRRAKLRLRLELHLRDGCGSDSVCDN